MWSRIYSTRLWLLKISSKRLIRACPHPFSALLLRSSMLSDLGCEEDPSLPIVLSFHGLYVIWNFNLCNISCSGIWLRRSLHPDIPFARLVFTVPIGHQHCLDLLQWRVIYHIQYPPPCVSATLLQSPSSTRADFTSNLKRKVAAEFRLAFPVDWALPSALQLPPWPDWMIALYQTFPKRYFWHVCRSLYVLCRYHWCVQAVSFQDQRTTSNLLLEVISVWIVWMASESIFLKSYWKKKSFLKNKNELWLRFKQWKCRVGNYHKTKFLQCKLKEKGGFWKELLNTQGVYNVTNFMW